MVLKQALNAVSMPQPSAEARAHSAALVAHIRRDIDAAGGLIGFERYMELALYAPELGYYSAGASKLGPEGDFVTAPEISPLFGQCVARQAAEVLLRLGGGDVLEVGAGSGALAATMLDTLERLGTLPERYLILERSAELAARQRARLASLAPALGERVRWLGELPREALRGVIVANELLDAFPVARLRLAHRAGLQALAVGWERGRFVLQAVDPAPALRAAWEQVERSLDAPLPAGYETELCPMLMPWVRSAGAALGAGALLLIDYGLPRREYYLPERRHGTLLCHYRHRAHDDVFFYPGLQDITAWVDFSAVALAARDSGLELGGFTTQAHFLLASGIEQALAQASRQAERETLAAGLRRLLLPGEMGERFRVIALTRGIAPALCGFTGRDLRDRL